MEGRGVGTSGKDLKFYFYLWVLAAFMGVGQYSSKKEEDEKNRESVFIYYSKAELSLFTQITEEKSYTALLMLAIH